MPEQWIKALIKQLANVSDAVLEEYLNAAVVRKLKPPYKGAYPDQDQSIWMQLLKAEIDRRTRAENTNG